MALWISTEKTGSDLIPIIRNETIPMDLDTQKKLYVVEDRICLVTTGRSIDPTSRSSSSMYMISYYMIIYVWTVIKKLYTYYLNIYSKTYSNLKYSFTYSSKSKSFTYSKSKSTCSNSFSSSSSYSKSASLIESVSAVPERETCLNTVNSRWRMHSF